MSDLTQACFADELQVKVFPFSRQDGGEETVIGRPETGVFLALPHDAVEILDDLAEGHSIGEVRRLYEQRHGEIPDLADFLGMLSQKGFVLAHDASGSAANSSFELPVPPARYHFESIPQSVGQLFFGNGALAVYALIIVTAMAVVIRDPSIVPGRSALLFERFQTPKLLAVVAASFLTIFVHEMAHLLAARAVGVSSRMGISNRLWVLVAETDITGVWSVPKRQRYLPIVAGPLIDLVSGSIFLLVLAADREGWISLSSLTAEMMRAIFFAYVLQFTWQFFFFVRTDFYYVLTTWSDCKNLLGDTETLLKNQVTRLVDRLPDWRVLPRWTIRDQGHIPAHERRMIRRYSIIWIVGRMVAVALLFTVTLPLTISYFYKVVDALRAGWAVDPVAFIDAIAMTVVSLGLYAVGMGLWLNNSRKKWKSER